MQQSELAKLLKLFFFVVSKCGGKKNHQHLSNYSMIIKNNRNDTKVNAFH